MNLQAQISPVSSSFLPHEKGFIVYSDGWKSSACVLFVYESSFFLKDASWFILFPAVCSCFHTMVELTSCNEDCVTQKAQYISYLTFSESLLAPGL